MPRGMVYFGIGVKQGAANKVGVVQQHVACCVDAFGENVLAVGGGRVGKGIAGKGRELHEAVLARAARLLCHAPFDALRRQCKEVARSVLGL